MADSEVKTRAIESVRGLAGYARALMDEPLAEALEDIANSAEAWLGSPPEPSETP